MSDALIRTIGDALGPKARELAPLSAELLAASVSSDRPNAHLLPVPEARRNFDADYADAGAGEDVHEVRDHQIAVDGAEITIRAFRPAPGTLPAIIYFHGGGWLLGGIDSHQAVCRALANASGAVAFSVDYRRGPESRFPAAVEDSYAAMRWVHDHAAELAIDGRSIAVAGDSAGGNLATVVALLARDRGGPRLAMQVLAYPVTTTDLAIGFDDDYEGFFLYRDELQWHQDNYLATPDQTTDPRVSPLEHARLDGLPPALVFTAQCDPLHRQGELYAAALKRAGVPTEHRSYPGMVHGFFALPTVFAEGAEAVTIAGEGVRARFAAPAGANR
jgi:acetyl esterase/lipase